MKGASCVGVQADSSKGIMMAQPLQEPCTSSASVDCRSVSGPSVLSGISLQGLRLGTDTALTKHFNDERSGYSCSRSLK